MSLLDLLIILVFALVYKYAVFSQLSSVIVVLIVALVVIILVRVLWVGERIPPRTKAAP
jgi:hypothetical protein